MSVPAYSGNPTITRDVLHLFADFRQPILDLPAKATMKQQILGRITRQGELGKQHQVGVEIRASPARRVDHARCIPMHVADQQVELRECNPE